jgi:hypothetical protein
MAAMLRPDQAADVVDEESFFVLEPELSDELEELEVDDDSEDEDDDVDDDSFEEEEEDDDALEELRLSVL